MSTPDITKAQVVATLQAVVAVALAFGLSLTQTQQVAILGLAGVVAGTLHLADAIIRHGRSRSLVPVTGSTMPAAPVAALTATRFEQAAEAAAAAPADPVAPAAPAAA